MGKPLVSFCVKSYNQRPYLRAALEGALAQTYRPLEIVVSDDASTDGSWELIQSSFAKATEDRELGISVVLNRNARNLGSLGNWEKLCELAHGELIVKADGDDVSLPERTTRIVEEWEKGGRKATVICHSGWQIGRKGEPKGCLRKVRPLWPLGAAMAFSPKIFQTFGWTADGSIVDDELYSRRGLMLGPAIEIPDRLVQYRLGSGATTEEWDIRGVVEKCARMSLKAIRQALADLAALPDEKLGASREELTRTFSDEERHYANKVALLEGKIFAARFAAYRSLAPHHCDIFGYQQLAFLMPRPIGSAMLFLYVLARNAFRRLQGGAR